MLELAQLLVAGVAIGSLYGVMALGVTALLKGTSVPNFAQGTFGLVAAYVSWFLATRAGVWLPVALVGGVTASSAVAYLADRLAMRRMIGAPVESFLVFTLGLDIALTNLPGNFFGAEAQMMPVLAPAGAIGSGSLNIQYRSLIVIVASAAIAAATALFFARTELGLKMRATSEHRIWPQYLGINVPAVLSTTWLLAGFLGGLAGILLATETYLDPNVMNSALIPAFTAGAIGGFRSIFGGYLGGIILGITENLVAGYISADYEKSVAFFFLLAVLIVRPQGLFVSDRQRRA